MRRLSLVLAAVLALLFGAAMPANAAVVDTYKTAVVKYGITQEDVAWSQASAYGQMSWVPGKQIVLVSDGRADGQGFGVYFQTAFSIDGICHSGGAHGVGCTFPLIEGQSVRFRMGRCAASTENCKNTVNWDWSSGWSSYSVASAGSPGGSSW